MSRVPRAQLAKGQAHRDEEGDDEDDEVQQHGIHSAAAVHAQLEGQRRQQVPRKPLGPRLRAAARRGVRGHGPQEPVGKRPQQLPPLLPVGRQLELVDAAEDAVGVPLGRRQPVAALLVGAAREEGVSEALADLVDVPEDCRQRRLGRAGPVDKGRDGRQEAAVAGPRPPGRPRVGGVVGQAGDEGDDGYDPVEGHGQREGRVVGPIPFDGIVA